MGPGVMGHMGKGAHEHNFFNTAWILTKILLDIDIDVFYQNTQRLFPSCFEFRVGTWRQGLDAC